jgi:hypothetical protein
MTSGPSVPSPVRATLVGLALCASSACGGSEPPAVVELALRDTYDVAGVVRVLPDGQTPASLRGLTFRYEGLAAAGGRLVGKVVSPSGEASISGTFDAETARFTVAPFALALTSTTPEQIVELGGLGFDASPIDGVVDDVSGYLRAQLGRSAVQAYTVASSRLPTRPATPEVSKLSTSRLGLGRTLLAGAPGAMPGLTGVELLVHGLAIEAPEFVLVQSRADGAFDAEIPASPGDWVVVRARTAGVASEPALYTVRD